MDSRTVLYGCLHTSRWASLLYSFSSTAPVLLSPRFVDKNPDKRISGSRPERNCFWGMVANVVHCIAVGHIDIAKRQIAFFNSRRDEGGGGRNPGA